MYMRVNKGIQSTSGKDQHHILTIWVSRPLQRQWTQQICASCLLHEEHQRDPPQHEIHIDSPISKPSYCGGGTMIYSHGYDGYGHSRQPGVKRQGGKALVSRLLHALVRSSRSLVCWVLLARTAGSYAKDAHVPGIPVFTKKNEKMKSSVLVHLAGNT